MVLLTCLAAGAIMQGTQSDGSLLAKLVPNPTGHNGYEDYLRAGDMIGPDLWRSYENWLAYKQGGAKPIATDPDEDPTVPAIPPGVTPEMTDLAVRKLANDHLGAALDIIRQGNEKQTYDPRQEFSMETTFPEMSRFKMLAKVGANKAHVEFAEGKVNQAVADLLEDLKFSKSVFVSTKIATLVSAAMQSIVLAEFQDHLGQLSLFDAQLVDKTCKSLIDSPIPLGEIYKREIDLLIKDIDELIDKPDLVLSPEELKGLGSAFRGLSTSDRRQLEDLVSQTVQNRVSAAADRMTGPESGWLIRDSSDDPTPSLNDRSVSNLAFVLSNELISKNQERQYARALARARVQLRLLRLHAQVIEYRWQHNKWPTKMEEFAVDNASYDPFGGEAFHYEFKEGGYRLYSLGIPGLGPIELRYHPLSAPQNSEVSHPRL